jgi:hypothetical protein
MKPFFANLSAVSPNMASDADPMDATGSADMNRALVQQSTRPVSSAPDLERSHLIPNNFTKHYQQACSNGVTTVNSQDPSQLNQVNHHATAAYSTLSNVHADQIMAHY